MSTPSVPDPDPANKVSSAGPVASSSKDNAIMDCDIKDLHYGTFKAVRDIKVPIQKNAITAFIGPSGCGKSTVITLPEPYE